MISRDQQTGELRIEWRILVPIIAGLILQTGGIVIWAARFTGATETRLDALERQVAAMNQMSERLTRIETISNSNSEMLREIRITLRRDSSRPEKD